MNFNEKLLSLRKAAGISQDTLAQQLGVSRQAVSKWELGTAMPETENIIKIAKIFCVETDWLLEHKVLAKTKIEINHHKTIKMMCFILYILLVGFMLLCLMLFTMNMADGVVDIIRPFSWLKPVIDTNKCIDCGLCAKACPGGAIGCGVITEKCASHISQKKGELTLEETDILARAHTVFGCDICQTVCPMNKKVEEAPNLFSDDIFSTVTAENVENIYKSRPFGWRGLKVLQRNMEIYNK